MTAPSTGPRSAARAILMAGLIAGVLDITAACTLAGVRAGVSPVRVFQSVAGGLLGPATFKGGAPTAVLGLALHFFIATGAAAVYYAASRKMASLVERPVLSGLLYGIAVWVFMNFVVLPLSAVTKRPFDPSAAAIMIVIHMLFVGLPIALAVRRFGPPPDAPHPAP